ncbi:MAG: YbhB/YbcL family Raf kinase inhibitor-like protein [Stenotrophobium sp.]
MREVLFAAAVSLSPLLAQAAGPFTLGSADIKAGAIIADKFTYKGYGCHGDNISPALAWHNAPAGTRSFALTVYDPDARAGKGWWHWVVFDIPATTTTLAEGSIPESAVQGRSDFGTPTYGGPCPPAGDKPHHYIFTLYALDIDTLGLAAGTPAATVKNTINHNTIGQASFTSLYSRR